MVATAFATIRAVPRPGAIVALRGEDPSGRARVVFRPAGGGDVARALVGRPAAEAPRLLRALLPAQGAAPGLACLAAVEAARGEAPDHDTRAARAMLALAETAVGLVAHACLDWPPLLSATPDAGCLRYGRAALDTLAARLWALADPLDPAARARPILAGEPAMSALIEALQRAVLPRAPADPLRLAGWAARDAAPLARLARLARSRAPAAAAALPPPPPPLPALAATLASDPGFGRAPALADGGPAEPGTLARLPAPLAAEALGHGPAGARFLATAHLALAVLEGLERLAPPPLEVIAPAPGVGAARVEGMRGPFVLRLALDRAGRIAEFAAVVPTAWMLHPGGPFAAALAALPGTDLAGAGARVIAAFDPGAPVALARPSAGSG